MDKKHLFVRTLEDLEQKSSSQDPYDIILMSGLIFKLLFDSPPLISEVISQRGELNFTFSNKKPTIINGLVFWSIEDGFDPDTAHAPVIVTTNKDTMYKSGVMIINGQEITVGDLIKYIRNVQGGVHIGSAKNEKQEVLQKLELFIGGLAVGLKLLSAISRVVVKGLSPLKKNLV
jgi:hypothetical protein